MALNIVDSPTTHLYMHLPTHYNVVQTLSGNFYMSLCPVVMVTSLVTLTFLQVEYLGKHLVDAGRAQDHGCTDEAVRLLWDEGR